MPEALHHLGVKAALQGLREDRFTSEALTRDCLTRITQLDPKIEAWAWLKSEAALETARAADHHRRAGKQGALLGVPVAIKDIVDVRGVPTRMGSPVFEDYMPSMSARAVSTFFSIRVRNRALLRARTSCRSVRVVNAPIPSPANLLSLFWPS